MGEWLAVLLEPAKVVLSQIGQFLVSVLLVIIVLLVGWLIAKLIKAVVIKGLRAVKLDTISDRIELDNLLAKGGISYSLSELIGVICYWLTMLITFMVAINAVGLSIAAELLNKIVLYIPNIIAAIFILILGMFVATLLRNIVQTTANNAGLAYAKILSKIVEVAVMIFAIAIALEQLNIGASVIQMIVTVVLGALGLGLALAFGLGCKDLVGRSVTDFVDKLRRK
jgi:small-conductance mechanosensitive channel